MSEALLSLEEVVAYMKLLGFEQFHSSITAPRTAALRLPAGSALGRNGTIHSVLFWEYNAIIGMEVTYNSGTVNRAKSSEYLHTTEEFISRITWWMERYV